MAQDEIQDNVHCNLSRSTRLRANARICEDRNDTLLNTYQDIWRIDVVYVDSEDNFPESSGKRKEKRPSFPGQAKQHKDSVENKVMTSAAKSNWGLK
jgi:hypothetical protein